MGQITGKDIVDVLAEGIEYAVKEHIRDEIIKKLVDDFEDQIQGIVDEKLSEMVLKAYSRDNPEVMRKELSLLIEWRKAKKEYKRKSTMQHEIIEE